MRWVTEVTRCMVHGHGQTMLSMKQEMPSGPRGITNGQTEGFFVVKKVKHIFLCVYIFVVKKRSY